MAIAVELALFAGLIAWALFGSGGGRRLEPRASEHG
jgi:hypothetical protein